MTKLEIINLALAHLGYGKITQSQLDADGIPQAQYANIFWEPCANDVLGEHDWSFATATQSLSSLDINDAKWDYCYTYPTLSVSAVWSVYNEATVDKQDEQDFERRHVPTLGLSVIFSNNDEAIAKYTYSVTDPELWDNKFVMAFSYRLAASMAIAIGADEQKSIAMSNLYNSILPEAKRLNSSEKIRVPNKPQKYIDSR